MAKAPKKTVELTAEEIHYLYTMIHVAGFREKSEMIPSIRRNRTDMQRVMGRILKKLRKTNHFIAG